MKQVAFALVLTLSSFCSLHAQHFSFLFTVHDNGGVGDTLEFGVDTRATYCEDQALREYNNVYPPPFPYLFTWTNPRSTSWLGDDVGCFDTGRKRYGATRKLDLRPFISTTQIDTYRVKFYSFEAGYPFHFSWSNLSLAKCDSMKLTYTGSGGQAAEVDMFSTSVDTLYDTSVSDVYIITYGAKITVISPYLPFLSSPPDGATGMGLFSRLTWDLAPAATAYEYEVSTDSLFVTTLFADTVMDNTLTVGPLNYRTTYFWRLRGLGLPDPGPWTDGWSFRTVGRTTYFPVLARWNLVSLPVDVDDPRASRVFPGALTGAYQYAPGAGYADADTLIRGKGYWMKYAQPLFIRVLGDPILEDTVSLVAGWNILGSVNDSIDVEGLVTDPPGILASPLFGYAAGFRVQSKLLPGRGHWVKASAAGTVVLSGAAGLRKPNPLAKAAVTALDALATLELSDTAGRGQMLYFGLRPEALPESFSFEMPPRAPVGDFDARFASQSIAEFARPGQTREVVVRVSSDAYPVTVRWNGGEPGAVLSIGARSMSLAEPGSALIEHAGTKVSLRLGAAGFGAAPVKFSLAQNYPNPFNPQTVIAYSIPAEVRVKIVLYNVLGAEVATIVDEAQGPGEHFVTFAPDGLPSGVYMYRITAGAETGVRKMVYIK